MGEQRNLTEENPPREDVEWKEDQPSLKKIFEKLEKIEFKLGLIFGNYVLIDGQFKEWTSGQK